MCRLCVLNHCFAQKKNMIASLPVKTKKIKVRNRFFDYYAFVFDQQILIRQRGPGDIWEGLYEFYLVEAEKDNSIRHFENCQKVYSTPSIRHLLTHQKLAIRFHVLEVSTVRIFEQIARSNNMIIISITDLHKFSVAKPTENFLETSYSLL